MAFETLAHSAQLVAKGWPGEPLGARTCRPVEMWDQRRYPVLRGPFLVLIPAPRDMSDDGSRSIALRRKVLLSIPGQLPPISYHSGGLESANIRQAVCDILEGGEYAFLERARRLRVKLSP